MDGYKLVEEYKESLLAYWGNGHGEILVLISELQGFLDCLTRLELIKQDDYMYIVDCFREEAKKSESFKRGFYEDVTMTDLEKMKKAVIFNGYKYEVFEKWHCISLEIVGFNSGRRLACFEFNKDGSFRLEE